MSIMTCRPSGINPSRQKPRPKSQTQPRPNPRDSWPAWTDEPQPTADFGHEPDAPSRAYWAGYCLGLDREDAEAPGHYSPAEDRAFRAGHVAGGSEWDRRLDTMYADRLADGRVTDEDLYPHGVC